MPMDPIFIPTRRWDCLWLGEVMLRLDPGKNRIHTARQFQAWEGGGDNNVVRGIHRCFGIRTAIATDLAVNPVGRPFAEFERLMKGGSACIAR
jgi:2-dehydro-3-deoxygluconokinase